MRMKGSAKGRDDGEKVRVVDLHLKPGYRSPDALERQISRVRGELNSAIRAGERQIILVHGSGSGILRQRVRETITDEYPSCSYQDAPFSRYGYNGATLVVINQ